MLRFNHFRFLIFLRNCFLDSKKVYINDHILTLEGDNLATDYPITILIGNLTRCNVLEKKSNPNTIQCLIQCTDSVCKVDSTWNIDVYVGELYFPIGQVHFEYPDVPISLGAILGIVFFSIVFIFILALLLLIFLRRRGYIGIKKAPNFIIHYSAEDTTDPSFSRQRSQNGKSRGHVFSVFGGLIPLFNA